MTLTEATPGVTMHFSSSDPFTTELKDGACTTWDPAGNYCTFVGEEVWVPTAGGYYATCNCLIYEQVSVYDPNSIFRGNLTKTTVYTDAATSSGAIAQTKKYDTTGNLVEESASCCELKTYDFTSATQYAYPTTKARGSSDPYSSLRNTTTGVFDFYTGMITQSTDANGRTNSTTYNVDSLRPTQTTSSTGAYSTSVYDDSGMSVTNETHEYGGALASTSKTYLNGLGKSKREDSIGPSAVTDIVETKYTNIGQVWKQSRPYRTGDTVIWTEVIYDLLGRTSQVISPDGSTSKAFYNDTTPPAGASTSAGESVRNVDAWGRERWERKDALGRLIEVLEPKVDGDGAFGTSGNLVTNYTYNTLGQMTQSNQGGQLRSFRYDSLGRMIRQKLAEQTATIDDNGAFVVGGGSTAIWSGSVTYDSRSNITQRVDARGVKANYSYQLSGADDPLNRIQGISYDLSGNHDTSKPIEAVGAVSYQYTTSGDQARINKIVTSGILTEDFAYDTEGRIKDYTQTVDYRTGYPWITSYSYDTLDRVTEIKYPAEYGMSGIGSPRRLVQNSYDVSSRISTLNYNSSQVAGNFTYNAASQITSIKVGTSGTNQVTENYTFDSQTGLLTNQTAVRNSTSLLDLSYDYTRNNSVGNTTTSWKTGAVTKILNNLNHTKDREYQFDALGRLTVAKGKATGQWTQTYVFDRYGNRTSVTATGTAADNSAMPTDGLASVSYDTANNRIATSSGFEYDLAGNQTRALAVDGSTWLRFEYDAANRLRAIKQDNGTTFVEAFIYGSGNARLIDYNAGTGLNTFSLNFGGRTMVEYTEYSTNVPTWTKSYVYLGDRQLATVTPNGTSAETIEYNHPDKLGTRLVTNQATGANFEQAHLPFGTALNAESSGSITKRFTSYERSATTGATATGMDYAQNRTYDPKQGRFTQVDQLGMGATSLSNPQSLNLYNYVGNDPINRTDPTGLFWGAIGRFFKAVLKVLLFVALVVAFVVLVYLGVGLIVAGGLLNILGGLGILLAASVLGAKIGATISSGIKEWLNRCNVPDYAGLSQTRRDDLSQRGVTPDQWNALRNNQRLGFFNIVAAIVSAGLSLLGWLVDWAAGGIQQDRTFFRQGRGATNLLVQVMSSSIFSPDKSGGSLHGANTASFRLNSFIRSTQLSFTPDGTRLDADIDSFNPNRGFGGFFLHSYEVASHFLGHIFGGTRTSPYNTAYRSSWECK